MVKSWEKFQHYKDRDPPWIKLYRDTLTTEAWVLGTDLSRLLQLASTMLAARYSNKIPLRFDLIKRVASLDCSETAFRAAVEHLVAHDFVEIQQVEDVRQQPASTALATCATTSGSLYSEQSRAEESRGEAEQNRSVELKLDEAPLDRVFNHWRHEFKHPKAQLDPRRRRAIQAALKAYGEATILASLSGYLHSPHHMGQNDQRTVYDDISLLLRDAEHVEKGLQFARAPPQPAKSAVELARENLRRSINGSGNGTVVAEQSGSGEGGVGSLTRMLR